MAKVLKITAAQGSTNTTSFNVVDSDGNAVDLTAIGATKVTVSVCAGRTNIEFDSSSDFISFGGDTISIDFGQFGLDVSGLIYSPKISYTTPTEEEEVIVGDRFETSIQLTIIC